MTQLKRTILLALMATCTLGFAACDDKADDQENEETVVSVPSEAVIDTAPVVNTASEMSMDTMSEEMPVDTSSEAQNSQMDGMPGGEIQNDGEIFKTVDVTNKEGVSIGVIQMVDSPEGLTFRFRLEGLPAGTLGSHVHEKGMCDYTDGFASAGGHYNPENTEHGSPHSPSSHAGDLGNITVPESGILETEIVSKYLTLEKNPTDGRHTLADSDGSAFIIHEGEDDLTTQPTGDAGGRFACAILVDVPENAPAEPVMETPIPDAISE